jgi:CBS domain containing-hemolysin-like protein
VRDRIGQREDRFFATVFLGSGLLFVGMLFVATAVAAGLLAGAAGRTGAPDDIWGHRIVVIVMNTYAMRMAAVFTIATATIGLRTGFMPRWIGFSGYAIAVVLLLAIGVTPWVRLLFPLWILLLSLDTLVESLGGRHAKGDLPSSAE